MPLSGPLLAASIIAEFISSTLVGRLGMNFKSIKLTLDVGTRIAAPSSLPASSGKTNPTALAAPVDVGTIEDAAPRALRRSP